MATNTPPSISETGFSCPHCGVLATQYWFQMFANAIDQEERRTPSIPDAEFYKRIEEARGLEEEMRTSFRTWAEKMESRLVFVERHEVTTYLRDEVHNLYLSKCFNCKKIAVWVHQTLVFPPQKLGVRPNPDFPANISGDFEEARDILNLSPRGAAALLRLCVQKLCILLGEKGKNIDDDIAALVNKGLDVRVQQALDVVRVIGNNAVHPGQIDLRDDRSTAEKLFGLVNLIAEIMISQPKHVGEMFNSLPEGALKAIEKRDGQKGSGD